MQDVCSTATNPSDSDDEEQLLVVGVIPSSKASDESSKMKVSSPQKRASMSRESVVKGGKSRGARRKLSCKAEERTDLNQMSEPDKDLHDEVIVVGRTSTEKREIVTAQEGDCDLEGRKDVTCRKLRQEALERISFQNMGQTDVESTSEGRETEQKITLIQLGKHEWTGNKDAPCLAVPSDVTLSHNVSSASKNWNEEQSTSRAVKRKSKLERIGPLNSKKRPHHTRNCKRKTNSKDASLEEVHAHDIEDGKNISKQELWFEQLGEKEDNEKSSSHDNHWDVNGHLETNNNNVDSKDTETSVTRQSTSLSEIDSDDELIDPSLEIDEEDFNEGDLVWARHPRNPFWPAVVKDISCGRQKKITVEYFNQGADVYRCQYSVRAIRPFIQYRKKMLIAGYRSEQSERFKLAVQEAMDYLKERALGKDIPLTTPVKEALSDQSNIHCQSLDSPPLTPTECQTTPLSPRASCSTPSEGHHSPPSPKVRIGLSRLFNDSEVTKESIAKEKERAKLRKKWDKIEDRLVKIILKDETKERLLRIWKGKVKSERHSIFFSSSIKKRDNLKYCAHLGALTSEEKIDTIAKYLSEIWKHNCQENKKDLPNTAYIFEVWLPEAILFAVMKSRKIGVKKAEEVLISEGRQVVKELEME